MDTIPVTRSGAIIDRSNPRTRGMRLFQLCVAGVIFLILAIFLANFPAALTPVRFWAAVAGLVLLLGLNLAGIKFLPQPRTKIQTLKDWLFLIFSALLVFGIIGLSSQFDLVYILSLVCIQADANQKVWPAGVIFSAAILLAWLGLQLSFHVPFGVIVGRELALAVGVVFGLVVVVLLQRTARQTEQAEALLSKLQAANHELELARQKDKELAIAEERLRLARDLHDSVTQLLCSVGLYAEAATEQLHSGRIDTATEHLGEVQETAQAALREMRLLIFELRRPALDQGGLAAAIRARLEAVEARGGLATDFQVQGKENLSGGTQAELYAITMEGLNNVLKHAHAQSVHVRLQFEQGFTQLEIQDDGLGFTPQAGQPGGFGITGMKERARKVGAQFQLESSPGCGTCLSVRVPTRQSESAG